MSTDHFKALEAVYEEVISTMDETFDSHEFILKIAHAHQKLYVQALIEYAENDEPFKIVHGQIAQRLSNFSNLVTNIGKRNSQDIFLQMNSASIWKKL